MTRPAWLRWPLMTKDAHERELERVTGLMQEAVDNEFARACREGRAVVHQWATEANYNVFNHSNPRGAAYAAFQEAEHMFRPARTDVKEALDAAVRP